MARSHFSPRPGPLPAVRPDDASPNPYRKQWGRPAAEPAKAKRRREKPVSAEVLAERCRHALTAGVK